MTNLRGAVWRPWLIGWVGAAGVAVANGTFRELVLRRGLDDVSARQVSTVLLLALLTGYVWLLERWWPLASTRLAIAVGAVWVAMTLGFEFGLGHYVEHKSWATLLDDYDLSAGHVWIAVPLWTLVVPAVVRAVRRRADDYSLSKCLAANTAA